MLYDGTVFFFKPELFILLFNIQTRIRYFQTTIRDLQSNSWLASTNALDAVVGDLIGLLAGGSPSLFYK